MTDTEVQPGPETDAGNDDVHADVRAAIAQLSGETDTDTEQAAAELESAPPERTRNERGQFIKADGSVDTDQTLEPLSDADKLREQPEQPSKAVEPPTSWSADAKAEWSKLSPATQNAVLKRENEINEGGRRWSEEKRAYDEMLSPVREAAQRAGVDEREGLQKLIAANDFLERDPENAIRWLAQSYGVDLSKPQSQQPQQAQQPRPDPVVNQLSQKLAQIESTLTAREQAEIAAEVTRFKSEPGHEHFEAVKADMGKLLQSGVATTLSDAYDRAVWANPEIRSQMLADQKAAAAAAMKEKAQQQTDRARRGAISPTGAPAGQPAPAKVEYETPLDAARAAARQHGWTV